MTSSMNPEANNQNIQTGSKPVESDFDITNSFSIDIRKLLTDIVRFWWLFALCLSVTMIGVFIYHKYKTPVYQSAIKILFSDASAPSMGGVSDKQGMMQGFAVDPFMRAISNQMEILKTNKLQHKVLDEMGIDICYYNQGRVVDREFFPNTLFRVVMDSTHLQPLNILIGLTITSANTYQIDIEAHNVPLMNYGTCSVDSVMSSIIHSSRHAFGDPVVTPWCAFSIQKLSSIQSGKYYVQFRKPYSQSFGLYPSVPKKEGSILTLYATGTNQNKNNLYLNVLARTFIEENLKQKNQVAENTIAFIEGQLSGLSDTLVDIGTELSNFQINHNIQQGVSAKGAELFSQLKEHDNLIKQYNIEVAYYDYLANYFSSDSIIIGNQVIAPAVLDVASSSIVLNQLQKIIELSSEARSTVETNARGQNPVMRDYIAKLQIARNTLLTSIDNSKSIVNQKIVELKQRVAEIQSDIMNLPDTERKLLGINRRFTLNNEVYNFLLRKRSEAQIQKASNTPDYKILDQAVTVAQVAPLYSQNYLFALIIGLVLPVVIILLRQILDTRIRTVGEVEKIAETSLAAEIPSSKYTDPIVVTTHPRSVISESFRRLRTRLDYSVMGKKNIQICICSSIPGEGKTYTASNVAAAYAINGRKTVLMGCDLRKPGLTKALGFTKQKGIVDYLIGEADLSEIVVNYSSNLDVIISGTIPPNPAELLGSAQFMGLLEELKKIYDVVVVDTPPMGLVSDAYQLSRISDITIFVVRQDYTFRDAFNHTVHTLKENGINNAHIVFNDINNKNTRYGYGYHSYGYGYGRYGKKRYGYGTYQYQAYNEYTSHYYHED